MAVHRLAVAFGVGAEDAPIFLARSSHHGPHQHTARMKYLHPREESISDFLGHICEGDSNQCLLSLLGIQCGAAITCSIAAQGQKKLNTLTDIDPVTRQILSKILSNVVGTCTYSSDFVTTLEVSGQPTYSLNTPTFSPVPSTSVSLATSFTDIGSSFTSSNPTGPSDPTPPSVPNKSLTGLNDASSSRLISDGSEGNNFKGSGPSETGAPATVSGRASLTDSPSLPTFPSPITSSGSSLTSITLNPSAEPQASLSLAPGGLIPSASESPTPQDPRAHHHNSGAILAIILGVLALLLCIAFAVLFFLRRRARARRKARRAYTGSPWQRLKPHIYDGSSSRPESSIWTWFGSIPIDTEYKAQPEPRPCSPESHLAEKDAVPPAASERLDAPAPRTSQCPSPAPSDTRPSSARSVNEGLPYLTVPVPSPLEASTSSSELLALAGTDYAVANPFSDVHEVRVGRSMSGVSRTTASSGDVQSVEAL